MDPQFWSDFYTEFVNCCDSIGKPLGLIGTILGISQWVLKKEKAEDIEEKNGFCVLS